MTIKQRTVHLFTLVALVSSLFSSVLTLPVTAEDVVPEPEVTLTSDAQETEPISGEPGIESTDDAGEEGAENPTPELTSVTPAAPIIADSMCGDGAVLAQTASVPVTEGVSYSISNPDAAGTFTLTATHTDSSVYTWADAGMEGWAVTGDQAVMTGSVALCPAPEPVEEEPVGSGKEGENVGEISTPGASARSNGMSPSDVDGPLLSMTITTDKPTANFGDRVTFTFTVTNVGTEEAGAYQFMSDLPDGSLAHVDPWEVTMPEGTSCRHNGLTYSFDCDNTGSGFVPLPVGESHEYMLVAQVTSTSSESVSTRGGGSGNPNLWASGSSYSEGEPATQITLINENSPSLTMDFVADIPTITHPDERLAFTITVTNTSSEPVSGLDVMGTVPFAFAAADWNVTDSDGTADCVIDRTEGTTVNCEGMNVPAQVGDVPGTLTVSYSLAAGVTYSESVCDEHLVAAGMQHSSLGKEPVIQQTSVVVDCEPTLSFEVTADTSVVYPGEIIDYTITVENDGGWDYTHEYDQYFLIFTANSHHGDFLADYDISISNAGCVLQSVEEQGLHVFSCYMLEGTVIDAGSSESIKLSLRTFENPSEAVCASGIETQLLADDQPGVWMPGPVVTLDCDGEAPQLSIEVSDDLEPGEVPAPGDDIYYTVTITNNGNAPVTDYDFSIGFHQQELSHFGVWENDAGRACTGNTSPNPTEFNCGLQATGELGPDVPDTFVFLATVAPAAPAHCEDGVLMITSPGAGFDDDNNQPIETYTPVDCSELNLSITDHMTDEEPIDLNEEFTYTITVTNTGTGVSGDFSFNSILPPGIIPAGDLDVRCTSEVVQGLFNITCSTSGVPVGVDNGLTFDIPVIAVDNDGSVVCEQEYVENQVSAGDGIWAQGQDSAFERTYVECLPSLTLDVVANKTEVEPGETITYTVTVTNEGSAVEDYYLFRVSVPVGADMAENPEFSSSPGLDCGAIDETTRSISCQYYVMQPGETHSISYTVRVGTDINSFYCQGINTSLVEEAGQWDEDNPSSHAISIRCPELRLAVTDNIPEGETVGLHEPFTYTVTVTNTGESAIGDFSFANVLPDGIVVHGEQDARCEPGTRYDSRAVWCSGSEVPLGDGNGIAFEINVVAVDTPVDTNYAGACPYTISYNGVHAEAGIWESDSRYAEEQTSVQCVSSVDFSIEPLVSHVVPGESIGFDVTVQNTGSTGITEFSTVDDVLPELPDGSEWAITHTLNGEPINPEQFPSELASGDTLKSTFESSAVPTDLTLPDNEWCKDWTMSSTLVAGFTWGLDQLQTESGTVRVNCTGLSVVQDVSSDRIQPGGEVEYTITVTNQGNTTVSPLMVFHDSSETGNVFSNWRVSGGDALDCGLVEDVYPGCTYLTLDPDESAVVTITGDAPLHPTEEQCAPVTSQAVFVYGETLAPARASVGLTPPYTQVSSDPVVTQLDCVSSFTFTNEALGSPVVPGETIGYELTVHNSGTMAITSLVISDDDIPELPDGGEWMVTAELNSAPVNLSDLEGLAAGDTLIVTIVSSAIPDDLTLPENEWCDAWTSSFTATAGFAWGSDQKATESATVDVECTGLTIGMDVSSASIEPGGQVEYTITVTNHGNTNVTELVINADMIAARAVFSEWSMTATSGGGVECFIIETLEYPIYACIVTALGPQQSAVVTITGEAPAIPTWKQCAPVESDANFFYAVRDMPMLLQSDLTPPWEYVYSNTVTTQLDCQAAVELTVNGDIDYGDNDRVDAGDVITYSFEVKNSGNLTLYDIIVSSEMAGLEWENEPVLAELLPGDSATVTATYVVTQADIDAGQIDSTAFVTASVEPESGAQPMAQAVGFQQVPEVPAVSADTIIAIDLPQEPGIALVQSGTLSDGVISYAFTITNTGNVTLTEVEVIDPPSGLVWDGETTIASLAPGEAVELTAMYLVTEADEGSTITICSDITTTEGAEARDCVDVDVPGAPEVIPTQTPSPTQTVEPEVPATPEPSTPPATPQPAAPEPDSETPAAVTKLPETGQGGIAATATILWAAAMLSVAVLGAGAIGIRRSRG